MEDYFTGALVAASLILIMLIWLFTFPPGWLFTLYVADAVIGFAFGWDFVQRFLKAPDKSVFFKKHGFEILASLPVLISIPFKFLAALVILFRILRLFPLIAVPENTTRLRNLVDRLIQRSHLP